MPELPEVETMRRGVSGVVGHTVSTVKRPPCERRPISITPRISTLARRMKGLAIVAVSRRGKRVILELSDGAWLVIEPRMTGLVLIADPPTEEHLRLRIELDGPQHDSLLFWDRRGLGTVRLLAAKEIEAALGSHRLGPDALEITAADLRQRLCDSRRAIKVALLDQQVVAGIGNLYAAEILFLCGIDPRCRCDRLTGPQWQRLASSIRTVLTEAIQYEGSTLGDGTYRNALNQAGSYQNHHRVYDHEDQTCSRCNASPIRRIVQAQRSTFFCPNCQRRSGLHPSLARENTAFL